MENSQKIPNVSCVFRQLVQLSQLNPRINSYNSNENLRSNNSQNSYSKTYVPNRIDFVSEMGLDDRQKKHQQLMNRLKNSIQQNRELLGVKQRPIQRENTYQFRNNQNSRNGYSQYSNMNTPNNNPYQNTNDSRQVMSNPNDKYKWIAPRIKYRHIQDFQQECISKENNRPQDSNLANSQAGLPQYLQKQMSLKQQFYGGKLPQKKYKDQGRQQKPKNQGNRNNTQQNQAMITGGQNGKEEDHQNKFSKISQRASKCEYNLESYYDLCRKPIKPQSISQKQTQNASRNSFNDKFIRKQVSRVSGINLQKAMNILSVDD